MSLLDVHVVNKSWEASQIWGTCVVGSKHCMCGEAGVVLWWCGLGDVVHQQWGTRVERGRRSNCFQARTQETCLIPAPTDVLLLFKLYLSEFCSLMKLAGPILLGILETCLPSCLLSPTPPHYCFTWDGVACFVPLPGRSLF